MRIVEPKQFVEKVEPGDKSGMGNKQTGKQIIGNDPGENADGCWVNGKVVLEIECLG